MRALMTVVGVLAAGGIAAGQPPAKRAGGLDAVPADGFAFVSVNVGKVHDADVLKGLKDAILKIEGATADTFEKEFGVALVDLERVTFLWPTFPNSFRSEEPIIVVGTRKPFNEARVLKALQAETFGDTMRRQDMVKPAFPGGGSKPAYIEKGIKKSYESKDFPIPPPPPFPGKEIAPPPFKKQAPELVFFAQQPAGGGEPDEPLGDLYVSRKMRRVVFLLDDSTAVLFPNFDRDPQQLLALVAKSLRKRADGPLAEALAVAGKHTAVAGIDFRPIRRELNREERFPRDLVPFRALARMDGGYATLDLDAKTVLTATLRFANAEDAARAEPVLKTAIQLVSEELGKEKKRSIREPAAAAVFGPIFDTVLGALDKATVKADGRNVVASATAEIGPAVEKALKALPDYIKYQAEEVRTLNNLKQLGLALHNYESAYQYFPSDIVDKAGKPILSWRVELLPYLEQQNLYLQIDRTKPWDDPGNAKVLAQVPKVFQVPGRAGKDGETYFQMFSAEKPVPGGNPALVRGVRRTFVNITDGTSNTFGIVEAAEGVNWAKPGDLPFDPKKLPALGDPKTGKFRVMFLDGSVRTIRRDKLTDDQLRAFITVDGGEINTFDFNR